MVRRSLRQVSGALMGMVFGAALLAASCGGDPKPSTTTPTGLQCAASLNTNPTGDPWVPTADPNDPVSASFEVTIDPAHAAFMTEQREPLAAPLAMTTKSGKLKIWGGVKKFVKHPERLFLELYFVNDEQVGWRDATVTVDAITGSASFYDFNDDVWSAPTMERTMVLGGIAPEGVGRIVFGFDAQADNAPIKFTLNLAGKTTKRISTSSSPIAVTPDGKEVWAVQGDADVVGVIDTASDKRVAQIKTPGKPSSIAITPDGKLALVACSMCNQVSVVDTATREIVQVFGEAEGIGRDPRNIVVSPDGTRAYVSAYVGDSVTALQRVGDAFRVNKEVAIGRRPAGISVSPDGETLLVAHYLPRGKLGNNEGWLSIVSREPFGLTGDAIVRDDGNVEEAKCLNQIPGFTSWTPEELSFEGAPTQLAGPFLDPSGRVAWVPGLRIGAFPVFEGHTENIGFDFFRRGANSPAAVFTFDARDPRKTSIIRASSAIDVPDRDENFLKCLKHMEEIECVIGFPVDGDPNHVRSAGAVVPSGVIPLSETGVIRHIGFTRGGRRVLFLSYVADEIMVLDGATRHPTARKNFMLSGASPTGMVLTPDGKKGYVTYENSFFVSVIDTSAYAGDKLPEPAFVSYIMEGGIAPGQGASTMTFRILNRDVSGVPEKPLLTEMSQIVLADEDPMDPVLRRGKILFAGANPDKHPTASGIRQAACAACHPDGGADGTVWATMEGERRTISLWGGTAGRGWLHASGTHRESHDFAEIIVPERLGGTGLSVEDQHALALYVAKGIPRIQAPKVDNALAEKGRGIFQGRCASCHRGSAMNDDAVDPNSKYGGGIEAGPVLHNLNSATDLAGAIIGAPWANLFPSNVKDVLLTLRGDRELGPQDPIQQTLDFYPRPKRERGAFKSPSLVNVWQDVLFFHDGRTDSLEEAVQDIAKRTGGELSANDLKAVVEYLKTL